MRNRHLWHATGVAKVNKCFGVCVFLCHWVWPEALLLRCLWITINGNDLFSALCISIQKLLFFSTKAVDPFALYFFQNLI